MIPLFWTLKYSSRESIRLTVMQKFKDEYGWNLIQFDDIKNYLADKKSTQDILQYNKVINSI
ncbi:MAG: hypothetical protein ACXVDW_21630, partial [Bacteroidia bacterium]